MGGFDCFFACFRRRRRPAAVPAFDLAAGVDAYRIELQENIHTINDAVDARRAQLKNEYIGFNRDRKKAEVAGIDKNDDRFASFYPENRKTREEIRACVRNLIQKSPPRLLAERCGKLMYREDDHFFRLEIGRVECDEIVAEGVLAYMQTAMHGMVVTIEKGKDGSRALYISSPDWITGLSRVDTLYDVRWYK